MGTSWNLPDGLPAGRLITPEAGSEPALWISDERAQDPGPQWTRLRSLHRRTGLWPLLLTTLESGFSEPGRPWHSGELAPVPPESADHVDWQGLLAEQWGNATGAAEDEFDFGEDAINPVPFRSWPGLAPPSTPGVDPDKHAATLLSQPAAVEEIVGEPYIGLVPAPDGAGTVIACGWQAEGGGPECTALLRSWQERFGVRLIGLGFDTLAVTVAWPPRTVEHAQRIAAEHYGFCPDLADETGFDEYAESLIDAAVWTFWWD